MKPLFLARCALLCALMCLCAWIGFPLGDSVITLQTFALFFTLNLLGGKAGFFVCLVYLLLGTVGLPVFSGFRSGIGALLGPTGGYLFGFVFAALVFWLLTRFLGSSFPIRLFSLCAGLLGCYLLGSLWLRWGYFSNDLSFWIVLLRFVIPYLLPDGIKLTLAILLSEKMRQRLRP